MNIFGGVGFTIQPTSVSLGKVCVKWEGGGEKNGEKQQQNQNCFGPDKRVKWKIQQNSPRLNGDENSFRVQSSHLREVSVIG